MEIGGYRTAPGLDELDLRGLVPDDVVAAKLMQQHHHEKRVGHRKQAATEMTADIIAVVPALMQCDPHCAEIVRDVLHTDAGEGKRRRSEEHTSELQSLMSISSAVFCLKKKIDQYPAASLTSQLPSAEPTTYTS